MACPLESWLASASSDSSDEGIRNGKQSFLKSETESADQQVEDFRDWFWTSFLFFPRQLFRFADFCVPDCSGGLLKLVSSTYGLQEQILLPHNSSTCRMEMIHCSEYNKQFYDFPSAFLYQEEKLRGLSFK